MKLLATYWYEHRSAVMTGENASEGPLGWRALTAPWRRIALC
jgi:hypothetical protein